MISAEGGLGIAVSFCVLAVEEALFDLEVLELLLPYPDPQAEEVGLQYSWPQQVRYSPADSLKIQSSQLVDC
jgi:hypothetical protein